MFLALFIPPTLLDVMQITSRADRILVMTDGTLFSPPASVKIIFAALNSKKKKDLTIAIYGVIMICE